MQCDQMDFWREVDKFSAKTRNKGVKVIKRIQPCYFCDKIIEIWPKNFKFGP
jgi:hypothetical protein